MNLPFEARQILIKLEMVATGSVSSYNSSGGGKDSERDPRPSGETRPPHLKWRALMIDKPWNMRQHIDGATKEWRALTGYTDEPKPTSSLPTVDERTLVLEQGKGHPPKYVAYKFGWSEFMVRRARIAADRDPETGEPNEKQTRAELSEDRRERILQRFDEGMGVGQIAMIEKISRQAVSQLVKRAA